MYGRGVLRFIDDPRWKLEAQKRAQEDCQRYTSTSYKLKSMAGGAAIAPSFAVFPLAMGMALGGSGNKYAPFALSAVSALTVVPFIMKLPMRKASYRRRVAVGNGILAVLGAAYSLHSTSKHGKRMCEMAMERARRKPPSGRGYPIGRPTP